jgi:type IV secretory pathway TraG/TraD family ATPase VirD4
MSDSLKRLRNYRAVSGDLVRGKLASIEDEEVSALTSAMRCSLLGAIVGALVWGLYKKSVTAAGIGFESGAVIAGLLYSTWPIWAGVWHVFRKGRLPPPYFSEPFPFGQKGLCLLILAGSMVYGFNHGYAWVKQYWQPYTQTSTLNVPKNAHSAHLRHDRHANHTKVVVQEENQNLPLKSGWHWMLAWLGTAYLLIEAVSRVSKYRQQRGVSQAYRKKTKGGTLPFRLWLGYSTGELAALTHGASLASRQHIALSREDAAQNILILGGIGSGKTTRAMHPFLLQLLDQGCGGLVFDIKGDFQKAVMAFGEQTQRPIITIGPHHQKMNVLAGLTPEMAASFLKSVFLLNGKAHGDAFWVDTAAELCRNTLGILSFLPAYYTLQGLYSYLFDVEQRSVIDEQIDALLASLEDKPARLLTSYWQYQARIFDKFDEKVKAGVNATVAQVLSPFNHPELIEAFCTVSETTLVEVLQGAVYLVSLPLSVWGLGGKVVYTLIKLRFYNVMQQRTAQGDCDQERPVFFMCDEFQEIVSANRDGLSDLNFWDKSRSSKTIGIISAQAISSFYAAIGDRDITHALLQNFRQKICFRTEDTTTLNYFNYLADKVEVIRKSYSATSGKQKQPGRFLNPMSHSTTENITLVDKPVLSPQLFRKLQPDQAIALLSVDGHSMDDIVYTMTAYV